MQVSQETGKMVWYSHLFKNLSQFVMIHTVKGFSLLYDPVNVGNLISGFSCFSEPSLDIWKLLAHIMLRLIMQDFKHDLTSMSLIA